MLSNTFFSIISSWKGLEAFLREKDEDDFHIYHTTIFDSKRDFSQQSFFELIKKTEKISKRKILKEKDFIIPSNDKEGVDGVLFAVSTLKLIKSVFIGLEISSTKDFIDNNITGLPLDIERIFSVHEHEPEFIAKKLEEIRPQVIVFVGDEISKPSRLMNKTAFLLANTDFIRNNLVSVFYLASSSSLSFVRKHLAVYTDFFVYNQKDADFRLNIRNVFYDFFLKMYEKEIFFHNIGKKIKSTILLNALKTGTEFFSKTTNKNVISIYPEGPVSMFCTTKINGENFENEFFIMKNSDISSRNIFNDVDSEEKLKEIVTFLYNRTAEIYRNEIYNTIRIESELMVFQKDIQRHFKVVLKSEEKSLQLIPKGTVFKRIKQEEDLKNSFFDFKTIIYGGDFLNSKFTNRQIIEIIANSFEESSFVEIKKDSLTLLAHIGNVLSFSKEIPFGVISDIISKYVKTVGFVIKPKKQKLLKPCDCNVVLKKQRGETMVVPEKGTCFYFPLLKGEKFELFFENDLFSVKKNPLIVEQKEDEEIIVALDMRNLT